LFHSSDDRTKQHILQFFSPLANKITGPINVDSWQTQSGKKSNSLQSAHRQDKLRYALHSVHCLRNPILCSLLADTVN